MSIALRSLRLRTSLGEVHAMAAGALDGSRPIAVALHGGFGSWRHWSANVDDLAASHDLLLPDLPGFGDSCGVPAQHGLSDIAEATLEGLSVALEVAPDALIGFSFGTLVASAITLRLQCLGRAPRRLMLVNPPIGHGVSPDVAEIQRRASAVARAEGLVAGVAVTLREVMLSRPDRVTPALAELGAEQVRKTRADSRLIARSSDIRDLLRGVRVRCDVVFGECDPHQVRGLDERAEGYRRLLGAGRVHRVPDAAHWLQYDRPRAFLELFEATVLDRSG
jgi:2-hydroxy-6-oxonona-2,4-dienedioate hydrolase